MVSVLLLPTITSLLVGSGWTMRLPKGQSEVESMEAEVSVLRLEV